MAIHKAKTLNLARCKAVELSGHLRFPAQCWGGKSHCDSCVQPLSPGWNSGLPPPPNIVSQNGTLPSLL